ncbi:MAG: pteridine reductase [Acidiferrobacterales bacterium]|nr:pteridine reductase [Acidiferrobacterales bacterium]
MTSLQDKVALITGGSRRVGATTARHLHSQGMRLVIHYRNSADDAEQLRAELCEERPDSVMLVRGDLGEIAKVKNLIQQCTSEMGRLDALVNNASAFYPTPVGEATEDQWQHIMDTNLKAPFFLAQAAAPFLRKNAGSIVNITDIYADRPIEDHPIYNASKAGLVSLTKSLARDLGPQIRVNAVAPGAIMWPEQGVDELAKQRMISRTPLKQMGEPMDIARAVCYLIRDAGFVTGQILNIDGGRTVMP